MKILTENEERATIRALKKLKKASGKMIPEAKVELGRYPAYSGIGGPWGVLSLTREGLIEETGFYDRCNMPSDCHGLHNSYTNPPKVVQPSKRLVEEYFLDEQSLQSLLVRLEK